MSQPYEFSHMSRVPDTAAGGQVKAIGPYEPGAPPVAAEDRRLASITVACLFGYLVLGRSFAADRASSRQHLPGRDPAGGRRRRAPVAEWFLRCGAGAYATESAARDDVGDPRLPRLWRLPRHVGCLRRGTHPRSSEDLRLQLLRGPHLPRHPLGPSDPQLVGAPLPRPPLGRRRLPAALLGAHQLLIAAERRRWPLQRRGCPDRHASDHHARATVHASSPSLRRLRVRAGSTSRSAATGWA